MYILVGRISYVKRNNSQWVSIGARRVFLTMVCCDINYVLSICVIIHKSFLSVIITVPIYFQYTPIVTHNHKIRHQLLNRFVYNEKIIPEA